MSFAVLVGERHGGKTTTCLRLAEQVRRRGLTVAGIVSRANFEADHCVGYDIVDLHTGRETSLARLDESGAEHVGRFGFLAAGLEFGRAALEDAMAGSARLIVVDEVGRLELAGGGWAAQLDRLTDYDQLTLMTVRPGHVGDVIHRWCRGLSPQRRPGMPPLLDLEHGADAAMDAVTRLLAEASDHGDTTVS